MCQYANGYRIKTFYPFAYWHIINGCVYVQE